MKKLLLIFTFTFLVNCTIKSEIFVNQWTSILNDNGLKESVGKYSKDINGVTIQICEVYLHDSIIGIQQSTNEINSPLGYIINRFNSEGNLINRKIYSGKIKLVSAEINNEKIVMLCDSTNNLNQNFAKLFIYDLNLNLNSEITFENNNFETKSVKLEIINNEIVAGVYLKQDNVNQGCNIICFNMEGNVVWQYETFSPNISAFNFTAMGSNLFITFIDMNVQNHCLKLLNGNIINENIFDFSSLNSPQLMDLKYNGSKFLLLYKSMLNVTEFNLNYYILNFNLAIENQNQIAAAGAYQLVNAKAVFGNSGKYCIATDFYNQVNNYDTKVYFFNENNQFLNSTLINDNVNFNDLIQIAEFDSITNYYYFGLVSANTLGVMQCKIFKYDTDGNADGIFRPWQGFARQYSYPVHFNFDVSDSSLFVSGGQNFSGGRDNVLMWKINTNTMQPVYERNLIIEKNKMKNGDIVFSNQDHAYSCSSVEIEGKTIGLFQKTLKWGHVLFQTPIRLNLDNETQCIPQKIMVYNSQVFIAGKSINITNNETGIFICKFDTTGVQLNFHTEVIGNNHIEVEDLKISSDNKLLFTYRNQEFSAEYMIEKQFDTENLLPENQLSINILQNTNFYSFAETPVRCFVTTADIHHLKISQLNSGILNESLIPIQDSIMQINSLFMYPYVIVGVNTRNNNIYNAKIYRYHLSSGEINVFEINRNGEINGIKIKNILKTSDFAGNKIIVVSEFVLPIFTELFSSIYNQNMNLQNQVVISNNYNEYENASAYNFYHFIVTYSTITNGIRSINSKIINTDGVTQFNNQLLKVRNTDNYKGYKLITQFRIAYLFGEVNANTDSSEVFISQLRNFLTINNVEGPNLENNTCVICPNQYIEPLQFILEDEEIAASGVYGESSNEILIPNSGINVSGSGVNRIIELQPAVNTSGTATITIYMESIEGQISSFSFEVIISPPIPTPAVTGLDGFCITNSALLSIDTIYSYYEWSNGSNTYNSNYTDTGMHYVIVKDELNCYLTTTFSIPACGDPNNYVTSLTETYCGNTLLSMTDSIVCNPISGATAYQFKFFTFPDFVFVHEINAESNLVPLANLSNILDSTMQYAVRVRAINQLEFGEFGLTCLIGFETDSIITNEETLILQTDVMIYPNPFSNQLTIKQSGIQNIEIFNIHGSRIVIDNFNHKNMIDTENWTPGMYLIKGNFNGKTFTRKLIKN